MHPRILAALFLLAPACADGSDIDGVSLIEIPLTHIDGDGTTYRLSNASFDILDAATDALVLTVVDDEVPVHETLMVRVGEGSYKVRLAPGWRLNLVAADMLIPVYNAVLVSPNPQPVAVAKGAPSSVVFRFKRPTMGQLMLGIDVDTDPWVVTGNFTFDNLVPPGAGNAEPYFAGLIGQSASFAWTLDQTYITHDPYVGSTLVATADTLTFGAEAPWGFTHLFDAHIAAATTWPTLTFDIYDSSTAQDGSTYNAFFEELEFHFADDRGDLYSLYITSAPVDPLGVDAQGHVLIAPFVNHYATFELLRFGAGGGYLSGGVGLALD